MQNTANFFTTRQLQEMLQVDRTTIYRMVESGQIPGRKIGNQWRFPKTQIEAWLDATQLAPSVQEVAQTNGAHPTPTNTELQKLIPLDCVQLIQDTFADMLGVMVVVTDLDGAMVTHPSNPCGLFTATSASPVAERRCKEMWAKEAQTPGMQPRFIESHLGLLCARGFIRVGSELRAMAVIGGVAPVKWPPSDDKIDEIATFLEVDADLIHRHIDDVFRVETDEQQRLLSFVQRLADIVTHIISERNQFYTTLNSIAEMTKM